MTKEDQNQIIKDALIRNLRKETEIPDDIGNIYKNWLLGKIQQAAPQLQNSSRSEEDMAGGNEQQETQE